MEKILILYSGGADSALMLKMAEVMGYEIECMSFDYGQKHSAELENDPYVLCPTISKHIKRDISSCFANVDSALTGSGEKGIYTKVNEYNVPARNTIFLSTAYAYAESNNIDYIWIGCDWSDRLNEFPDCYQEYIIKINDLFKSTASKYVKIEAPLMGLTKENVCLFLENMFKVNKENYFSGYGDI